MIKTKDETLVIRVVGVGQAMYPDSHFTQAGVTGAPPFFTPSNVRKGYNWPGYLPVLTSQIRTAKNITTVSQVTKSHALPGNSRWSATDIKDWLLGHLMVRKGYTPPSGNGNG